MNLWPASDGPEVKLLLEQHGDDPKWLALELARTRYERESCATSRRELEKKLRSIREISERP